LENLFAPVQSVYVQAATHIPRRWDEQGQPYKASAEDAAYAIFELADGVVVQLNSSWTVRVNRPELVEFQVDGTDGSAVAGLFDVKVQPRAVTPKPVWDPDLPDQHVYASDWITVPDNTAYGNGFKQQWEEFLTAYALDQPYPFDLWAGARGIQLAEAALESNHSGRKINLSAIGASPEAADANH
jgi:predicted dehydrogenase